MRPVSRTMINPRRSCAARVTGVVLCACVSVSQKLTSEASDRLENAVTYSTSNVRQNILGFFSETDSLLNLLCVVNVNSRMKDGCGFLFVRYKRHFCTELISWDYHCTQCAVLVRTGDH